MKAITRAEIARQTMAICDAGFYIAPNGTRIAITDDLASAMAGTVVYLPGKQPVRTAKAKRTTHITLANETTFEALVRLDASGTAHLACLNFASAKNPGGGFLKGALSQEEALCYASALYPCLVQATEYYEKNRANPSALYLDAAIFSPRIPFFRDDNGALVNKPVKASVITAPAPNAGAVMANEPANLPYIEPTLKRRAELVLRIAEAHDVDILVLGAWGCGVFRNDPQVVAYVFAELLNAPGAFAGSFSEVAFAVFDRSPHETTYRAFADQFNERNPIQI